jgi:hypothetical protein
VQHYGTVLRKHDLFVVQWDTVVEGLVGRCLTHGAAFQLHEPCTLAEMCATVTRYDFFMFLSVNWRCKHPSHEYASSDLHWHPLRTETVVTLFVTGIEAVCGPKPPTERLSLCRASV